MKTPYDAALRVAEQRLDRVRTAIGRAVDQLQRIDAEQVAAEQALMHEVLLAVNDHRLTTERYFVAARDRRTRLGEQRGEMHATLEALRRKAVEYYGKQAAIDIAVVRYRDEAERAAAAVEQAAMDDLAGARYRQPRRAGLRVSAAASPP